MPTQSNQANLVQLLRRIPPKWALAIVGLVLLYWLGQPILNRTFGWNLPAIAAILGDGQAPSREDLGTPSPPASLPEDGQRGAGTTKRVAKQSSSTPSDRKVGNSKPSNSEVSNSKPNNSTGPKKQESSKSSDFLTEVGPDRYRSPAGLFYTRGSEEGHRLKHIAKHLQDQPTRPGSHGVFDGDLNQVLCWIDEAYQKAKKGDRSARTFKEDDGSTKYEVTFDKQIGYVGGSDGKSQGNPPAKRLRLIVRGQNVTTAFPF